jgi:hypothetical protein
MTYFVVRRWDLTPYPGDQAPPHVHRESDEERSDAWSRHRSAIVDGSS